MKVSINWLKQYVNLDNISVSELEEMFSLHLSEVEEVVQLANINNLTVGYVHECVMHPDSDHLHVCQVEVKPGEILQIVCGAPNVAAGEKVIVANIGAKLPGDFEIKKSKIRGQESNGMLCSFQELGIPDKYILERFKDGIVLLDKDAPIGEDVIKYLGLDDYVFDLSITPNRADMLSMIGVAYDVASYLGKEVKINAGLVKEEKGLKNPVQVELQTDDCYQYNARYIEGVTIKESPWWLQERLIASGIRPINNVVDISNYILMEYGQPLHTFDGDKLGTKIVVRNAYKDEKFVTLDEIERTLDEKDIVITDGEKPVCLGGVMGGLNTEVDNNTKTIVLEAAEFNPTSIRKTSSRLGLRSESSYRFERKIDSLRVKKALDQAAYMIQELAGGKIYEGVTTKKNRHFKEIEIDCSLAKINSYLGLELSEQEVSKIISNMQFKYTYKDGDYHVIVPSRRIDYENNYQDLIEDIARFYGYNNIPESIPSTKDSGHLTNAQAYERGIKTYLAGLGLNEVITYSLSSKDKVSEFNYKGYEPIKVLTPITEEKEYLRVSLIPSLLEVISYNKARKLDNQKVFEISNIYAKDTEKSLFTGAFTGLVSRSLWQQSMVKIDFYFVKGILEELFARLNITPRFEKGMIDNLHPGKTALIYVGQDMLGFIGQVHPTLEKEYDIKDVYVFELDFDKLLELASKDPKYHIYSKYPSITRDLAIVVSKDVPASKIEELIKQTARKYLVNIELFDLYEDASLGDDKRQLAYKLVFADNTKTLDSSDVDKVIKSVLNRLEFEFKATLRS